MNYKSQVHALIKQLGIHDAGKKVKVSALTLVCYVAGYGKPQARTIEALEKFFSKGKKAKAKAAKPKAKPEAASKPKASAKVKAAKPKPKPKAKVAKPKELNSKPAEVAAAPAAAE